ncbi:MAG: hypothetical protein ABDI19_08150 [Armatimonadota bacterium]
MYAPSTMPQAVDTEGGMPSHLSTDQLLQLVEQGRRCPHYQEWIDHIVQCETCRMTYKYLLSAEEAVREARRPPWQRLMRVGVPAVAVAAAALAVWFLLRPLNPPSQGWQSAIRQVQGATYEGAVRLPEWAARAVARLQSPPPTVRSGEAITSEIRLQVPDPANEAIATLTPLFRWQAVLDAQGYIATLTPLPVGELITLQVQGVQAQLPSGMRLKAGASYRLRIEARLPGGLPSNNPFCDYVFRTLTPAEQAQLDWARQHARQAPYTSAMVFYQLGFYREALATLPNEPSVQRWREAIARQIAQRTYTE